MEVKEFSAITCTGKKVRYFKDLTIEALICTIYIFQFVGEEARKVPSKFPQNAEYRDNSTPIVRSNYNHTMVSKTGELEAWDSYIVDEEIVMLLEFLFKRIPDSRFAEDILANPNLKYYFTPPYTFVAKELGYASLPLNMPR